jgi:hypothetical protein
LSPDSSFDGGPSGIWVTTWRCPPSSSPVSTTPVASRMAPITATTRPPSSPEKRDALFIEWEVSLPRIRPALT